MRKINCLYVSILEPRDVHSRNNLGKQKGYKRIYLRTIVSRVSGTSKKAKTRERFRFDIEKRIFSDDHDRIKNALNSRDRVEVVVSLRKYGN